MTAIAPRTEEDTYNVYVVRLDDSRRRNTPRPAVYVGQTAKDPVKRFEQHTKGERHSRVVRDYGQFLCPELYRRYNPIGSRTEAEAREARLAECLRRLGFTVYGGH
jgi:hypothetical protein